MSRWRLAARLARREARRHWVRSLLVVAIIALPLAAGQAAAIVGFTVDNPYDGVLAANGDADASVSFDPRDDRPSAGAPGGNPTGFGVPVERTDVGFDIGDWTAAAAGHGRGPDDLAPLTVVALVVPEAVDLVDGRLPRTRHEAVIDRDLARAAGVAVGDDLRLVASRVDLTVVGVARGDHGSPVAAVGPPAPGERDWAADAVVRIRSADQAAAQVRADMIELVWFVSGGPDAGGGTGLARPPSTQPQEVVVAAVVFTIAVGFVAVTSSVAFAIGARRQLRQLGTLSAAGAAPGDLARAVVLQGSTLGLVGAALATVTVYGGRAAALRWVVDPVSEGGPVVPLAPGAVGGHALLGVVAGTLAALVPALTASRLPVLSALAGRRPATQRPTWSPWAGGVVVLVGLAGLAAATAGRHVDGTAAQRGVAWVALAVLAVMAGSVALSPAVVATIARLVRGVGGTARLAGRSLSRDRMRSSAVIAAAAVALAIPVVLILWSARDTGEQWPWGPAGWAETKETAQAFAAATERTATISMTGTPEAVEARRAEAAEVLGPDVIEARPVAIRVADEGTGPLGAAASAVDPEVLRRVTGDHAIADLLDAGAVVRAAGAGRAPWTIDGGGALHDVPVRGAAEVRTVALAGLDPRTIALLGGAPAGLVADDATLDTRQADAPAPATDHLFVTLYPLPAAQEAALGRIEGQSAPTLATLEALAPSADLHVGMAVFGGPGPAEIPWDLVATVVAALVALLVIGVALALSGADGRSDDLVVTAAGAPPTTIRRRRALEALFTAAGAAVLGAGVAGAATLTVIHSPAITTPAGRGAIHVPFVDLTLALGLPVVAIGGLTWLVLATGDRLRGRRDLTLTDP